MGIERQKEIEFRLRKNAGFRKIDKIKSDLSKVLNIAPMDLKFCDLKLSDEADSKFNNDFQKYYKDCNTLWWDNEEEEFKVFLKEFCKKIPKENLFVFLRISKYCGCFELNSDIFFQHAYDLLILDGDSIWAQSQDSDNGIALTFYESDSGYGRTYEVNFLSDYTKLIQKEKWRVRPPTVWDS